MVPETLTLPGPCADLPQNSALVSCHCMAIESIRRLTILHKARLVVRGCALTIINHAHLDNDPTVYRMS